MFIHRKGFRFIMYSVPRYIHQTTENNNLSFFIHASLPHLPRSRSNDHKQNLGEYPLQSQLWEPSSAGGELPQLRSKDESHHWWTPGLLLRLPHSQTVLQCPPRPSGSTTTSSGGRVPTQTGRPEFWAKQGGSCWHGLGCSSDTLPTPPLPPPPPRAFWDRGVRAVGDLKHY